jgi:DnaJ domain
VVAAGRTLFEVLNGSNAFLEFEPFGGEKAYLAKSTLKSVKLISVPRAHNLSGKLREIDGFDPYGVLGVPTEAPWDQVRGAYLKLSKTYHPDRYATAELPDEVRDYLSNMARRVNAAYAALEAPHLARKEAASLRQAPIFTSQGFGR